MALLLSVSEENYSGAYSSKLYDPPPKAFLCGGRLQDLPQNDFYKNVYLLTSMALIVLLLITVVLLIICVVRLHRKTKSRLQYKLVQTDSN